MSDVAWMLADGVSHDANVPRWATAALAGDVGGVCGPGHLAVSQDDTPAMRVKVAAGYVLVRGGSSDDQGMYAWWYPGGTVDIAPGDPSNPRNTIVGVQVDDDYWDASGENRCRVVAVDGTPAGAPVDPSLPASFTRLARVRVDQNESTSIVNGDLTDLRVLAGDAALRPGAIRAAQMQSFATLSSGGTTSGNTPLTVASTTRNFPAAGAVYVSAHVTLSKGASGDKFDLTIHLDGGGTLASATSMEVASTPYTLACSTVFSVSAGSRVIESRLTRTSGSGANATVTAGSWSQIAGIYLPA